MVTFANNQRLTRVEGDAPLGRMIRENYWIPFARSEAVQSGEAPARVRLLGRDLVVFRAEDGSLGLVDEHCPHRRASLALARVEGCSLRCIYHGWRIEGTGAVVEVPSEGARSDEFARRIEVNRYHVREGGGLVWAYMGKGEPPELPPLPFLQVPSESRRWSRMLVNCNWLQGFEGALDSVHLNWLHQGWPRDGEDCTPRLSPDYEVEETRYGLRTAAIRKAGDVQHIRVAEFIAPFYALSASRQPAIETDNSVFISVPVDDVTHMLFFGFWDRAGPLQDISAHVPSDLDPNNLTAGEFSSANTWGQDREAMARGHFSGFTKSVLHEDVAVQVSMGPLVDRSLENLCSTDLAIVRMRNFLLAMLDGFEGGGKVDGEMRAYRDEGNLPLGCSVAADCDWRTIEARAGA